MPAIETFSTLARILEGPVPYLSGPVVAMLDQFVDGMRDLIERFVQRDTAARRLWELIDLLTANIRGIVAAGLEGADDFSSLDKWNYIDWLRMNRIAEQTLNNPIIRGAHDLGFAYRDGNARDPQIAAGQAISAGCRFFFMYKGALFWRMRSPDGGRGLCADVPRAAQPRREFQVLSPVGRDRAGRDESGGHRTEVLPSGVVEGEDSCAQPTTSR